jgi:hypothetical protein
MTLIEDMDIVSIEILGSHVRKSVEVKNLLNLQPHGNRMTRRNRRSGSDRRSFSYDRVIPDRRCPRDRRRQKERRNTDNSNDRFKKAHTIVR